MKILFIGAAKSNHTMRWVNALSERGHEVMLVTRPDQKDEKGHISKKVKIVYLKYGGTKGYYLNVFELRKVYKTFNPDVTNVHYASGYATMVRLAKLKHVVLSCWGSDVYDFPFQSKTKMRILCKNLRYADTIASTSYAMAKQVKLLLKDENQMVYVTPFGVDTDKFKKVNSPKGAKKVIGIVKYLEPIYDVQLLIRAFKLVHDVYNNVELKIYGDGKLRSELEELTKELSISEDVHFYGTIPNFEVPNALNDMDIFVNCSLQESFGVAIVEAMACQLPVVATDTEGFKEVIENGKTGFILHDRKPETMANKLLELLKDDKMASSFANCAREKVIREYDWNKNVEHMVDIYLKTSKIGKN